MLERQGEAGAVGPDSRDSVLPCRRQKHVERCVPRKTEEGAEHYSFCTGTSHHEFQSRQGIARQVLNDMSTREEEVTIVWSTTNSLRHHPVDGFTLMVNGMCALVCVRVCVRKGRGMCPVPPPTTDSRIVHFRF